MPGFDRTGPRGAGPRTGWGRGPCGAGMAFGRGWRCFGRAWNPEEAVPSSGLAARLAALEEEVRRLSEERNKAED
ncbi:MAG: DUF5320 domain-containing protein [Synergistaceae bacterium]|nr:DUF5320 domain-containing protein [Synergistaceae bacterium]